MGYSASNVVPFAYRDYMFAYMDVDIDLSGYSSATLTFYYKMPSVDDDEDYGQVLIDYNEIWRVGPRRGSVDLMNS